MRNRQKAKTTIILLIWAARLVKGLFPKLGRTLALGQAGECTRNSLWHLLSPSLEWRMNVLLNPQFQGYSRREHCLPQGTQRSVKIPALSGRGASPHAFLPAPSAVCDGPFPKEQSGPPAHSPFILPEGSCLDSIFQSLLTEFCLFKNNLIVRWWIDCVCFPRYLHSKARNHYPILVQKWFQNMYILGTEHCLLLSHLKMNSLFYMRLFKSRRTCYRK